MESFDVIVLGLGAMGSAAARAVAKRGKKVLGLDRFSFGHDRGSSHGESRLTRLAYFEHSDYVPLLKRSHALWRELEKESGRSVFHETGLLYFGRENSAVLSGVRKSAALHGLKLESLTQAEVRKRYPAFTLDDSWDAVLERTAGFLDLPEALTAFGACPAKLLRDEAAVDWTADGRGYVVRTARASYRAEKLILTLGPWSDALLKWPLPLEIRRQTLFWFSPKSLPDLPCYAFDYGDAFVYGFPPFHNLVKIADHTLGSVVAKPDAVDRKIQDGEARRVQAAIEKVFPWLETSPVKSAVCLYTMTPDSNFVVDLHPEHEGVAVACGFSGHGFKFAPVMGECLADLALDGRTSLPVGFLSGRRFGN